MRRPRSLSAAGVKMQGYCTDGTPQPLGCGRGNARLLHAHGRMASLYHTNLWAGRWQYSNAIGKLPKMEHHGGDLDKEIRLSKGLLP